MMAPEVEGRDAGGESDRMGMGAGKTAPPRPGCPAIGRVLAAGE